MRGTTEILSALMLAAGGISDMPQLFRSRYRPPRPHKRRLLKRTGWHVCEHDGCKVRARTEAEFERLANGLRCPADVQDVRAWEVDHG